ncbi:sel1 repeat family protein [Thalassospira sp. MA62]|nr:sel1 repeat family protein [Thalassospira sp. MA62]
MHPTSPNSQTLLARLRAITAGLVFSTIFAVGASASSALDDGIVAYQHGDFEKSARIFRGLADNGNATAQYLLSCQTINGVAVPADEEAGWQLMAQASDNNNPNANVIMARRLAAENGNPAKIRALYDRAARQNNTQAMLWLALDALDHGNAKMAQAHLKQAWELGDPRAATLLANRFAKSDVDRLTYLRRAAQRGEMRAAAYLAEEARTIGDTAEAVGWCAIATGMPGHKKDVDWKTIGDAVEKNCGDFDKDMSPEDRAINRERVDHFLAGFFKNYEPWQPWRACAVEQ